MSKSTISTFELFQMFPDQESARVLGYRSKDKGLAAKKTERRVKRAAKKEAHDDRDSSI
jgi:hypothetical protein